VVVLIDTATLATLPVRELGAGLFEAIKYGVIRDRRLFNRMVDNIDLLKRLDDEELNHLIRRCCSIKADVVARDEREGGLRQILNFGHTVGHALEAVTGYRRFLHGEAVGVGMIAASGIAEAAGLLDSRARKTIREAVNRVGRVPTTKNIALDAIMSAMQHDKKARNGQLTFVLPVAIGRVVTKSDLPPKLIRSALKSSLA
jgi:3-dehydroquinate synthase